MMSEISYHQQQYIRHQKREKKLVLFLRIFILLFFLVLWEISARTGLIDSFIFSSPVMIWHSFCSMCRDGSIFLCIKTNSESCRKEAAATDHN